MYPVLQIRFWYNEYLPPALKLYTEMPIYNA